jgi:kynurenine formamidase
MGEILKGERHLNTIESLFSKQLLDLSITNSESYPGWWPTVDRYRAQTFVWYDSWLAPCYSRVLTIEEHAGTHFDSPSHFIPPPDSGLPYAGPAGDITVEKVPLDQLMGPAVTVDCRHLLNTSLPGESPIITIADMERWEAEHGRIQPGEVVLFSTGWTDDHYVPFPEGKRFVWDVFIEKKIPGWPAPGPELMDWLDERGVRCVGTDTPSMGPVQADAETHWAGLGKGMVFVEKLVALHKLKPRGAFFMFLPIKCEGSSGCPGRAIAFVDRDDQ